MTLEQRVQRLEAAILPRFGIEEPPLEFCAAWWEAFRGRCVTVGEAAEWMDGCEVGRAWRAARSRKALSAAMARGGWSVSINGHQRTFAAPWLWGDILTGIAGKIEEAVTLDQRDPPTVRQLGTNHAIDLGAWNGLRVQDQRGQHPPARTITLTASGPPGAGKTRLLARIAEVLSAEYKFTRTDARPDVLVVSWTREEADHG